MKPESRHLSFAFGLSLLLHALPLAPALLSAPAPRHPRPAPPLEATLHAPPQPELKLKEAPPAEEKSTPPSPKAKILTSTAGTAHSVTPKEAVKQAMQQLKSQLLYPPEAVRQGLEGDTLVTVFLDEGGNAMAARVEASSGHKILDDAAIRAARLIRSLPDSAPREVALPVTFRLR